MAATQHRVGTLGDVLRSRQGLHRIIQTYKLYAKERERMPIEDVIDRMRRDIAVRMRGEMIEASFSYGDPVLAQRITRDSMARMIDAHIQERGISAQPNVPFWKQQAEEAAAEWARQFEALRKAQPGTAAYERLAFDRELARRRYEQLRTMEFEGASYRSPALEILDLPHRPQGPVGLRQGLVMLGGLAAGVALACIAILLLSVRAHRLLPREV